MKDKLKNCKYCDCPPIKMVMGLGNGQSIFSYSCGNAVCLDLRKQDRINEADKIAIRAWNEGNTT